MTKTIGEARTYAERLRNVEWPERVQPFVIPPATALAVVAETLGPDTRVLVGAQDAHWEDAGAWTGEVSVPQVADAGARLLEIGHSERRAHFGETDERVNLKVHAALRHGVLPLVCVGEDAAGRAAGRAVEVVVGQARAALSGVAPDSRLMVAYEPVWAIGEHGRAATPTDVTEVVDALVRTVGPRGPVLYGGSVDLGNCMDLAAVPGVGGLFIGRAAWDADDFVEIVTRVSARH